MRNRSSDFPVSTLVIGIGADFRSDDGAGLVVARTLRAMNISNVTVIESSGDGAALIREWGSAERVILVDAIEARSTPGTIFRFDANAEPMPSIFRANSSHNFGAREAIELARTLNELPQSLVLYGIQGENVGFGRKLTECVRLATEKVVAMIIRDMAAENSPPGTGIGSANLRITS